MTEVIIAVIVLIGAACLGRLGLLGYLLRRDRGKFWQPGDDCPAVPDDATEQPAGFLVVTVAGAGRDRPDADWH